MFFLVTDAAGLGAAVVVVGVFFGASDWQATKLSASRLSAKNPFILLGCDQKTVKQRLALRVSFA